MSAAAKDGNNHVAEWFGHRVFPIVAATEQSGKDQRAGKCPFLTEAVGNPQKCVKSTNSQGVCTISSNSNGQRQDWLVCPFRALDRDLLGDAVRRLFEHDLSTEIALVAATVLEDVPQRKEFIAKVAAGVPGVIYFQNKLGGEISISATSRSPEMSFDSTMVEISIDVNGALKLGRYGIFEIQTMDFHGTYAGATKNLVELQRMFSDDFAETLAQRPSLTSERVEGPNISNVFKRTFYQMMFKFQIGAHDASAGCVFAIPRSVWDSWQRHLGAPALVPRPDGTWTLGPSDIVGRPTAWIYVFDLDLSAETSPNKVNLWRVIATDAPAMSYYALDVAPAAALEEGGSVDRVMATIRRRLLPFLPELAPGIIPARKFAP